MDVYETEKKYLAKKIIKSDLWDREQIVYQWYIEKQGEKAKKIKVIFDLTQARIIYVSVTKEFIDWGKSKKEVEYLDIREFRPNDYINSKFILKRRSIKNKVFLDKFIRSNGKTEYLIEDEGDCLVNNPNLWGIELQDVTDNQEYYNEKMCVDFTENDAEHLSFMLNCFQII